MRSIFIGTRIEAFRVLEKCTLVKSLVTKKNSYVDRLINKNKYKLFYINNSNKEKIFKFLKNSDVDLILSCGFPFIIPSKYLNKKIKMINSHPSLLPKYKGFSPLREALKNKENKIGVTVHYINSKVDEGKIIVVKKLYIGETVNIKIIYKKIFSITEPQAIQAALNKIC